MKQLTASESALRAQIEELEGQKARLADPVFIAAQAREGLGFVMPGDIPYQVQLPPSASLPSDTEPRAGVVRNGDPWYSSLWHTIADTPHGPWPCTGARPAPPGAPEPDPRRPHPHPVVDPVDLDAVAQQLGREPRGVLEIAYRCPNGEPASGEDGAATARWHPVPDGVLPDPSGVDSGREPTGVRGSDADHDRSVAR